MFSGGFFGRGRSPFDEMNRMMEQMERDMNQAFGRNTGFGFGSGFGGFPFSSQGLDLGRHEVKWLGRKGCGVLNTCDG